MKIDDYITEIEKLGACSEAIKAARKYKTSQELWAECKRGDWMLWLIGKKSGGPWSDKRRKLVKTTCRCVRTVYDLMPQPAKDCLELFERWATGEDVPQPVLLAAADAAYAARAADAAYAARAAFAARAAAYAGYAVARAADAAYAAARATFARKPALADFADMVREDYPDIDEILEGARR